MNNRYRFFILLFLLFGFIEAPAQVLPREGTTLNYRVVGFSFPAEKNASYSVEIALGNYSDDEGFKKNVIKQQNSSKNKLIIELPSFGETYTWRVLSKVAAEGATGSKLYHFQVGANRFVDTSQVRLNVTQHSPAFQSDFVFIDGNRALYDMEGRPVWYLPDIEGINGEEYNPRDIKMTQRGTLTFLFENRGAYEINLQGKVLWKAPRKNDVTNDTAESYHHELTRLANGHYMVMGNEYALWSKDAAPGAGSNVIFPGEQTDSSADYSGFQHIDFGTIIEYDPAGHVVWSWKSSSYFKGSDIYYHTLLGNNFPDVTPHENSFYFDEKHKVVYISFRDISRIIKVKYPEGTVLAVYGETFKPGVKENGNGLFCFQHSLTGSSDSLLGLFNNNVCNPTDPPQVLLLGESHGRLKKMWEYDCVEEKEKMPVYRFTSGGNISELPDHSFFVCIGSKMLAKVFIVNREKQVLWSAIPQKFISGINTWIPSLQYKGTVINLAQLEELVWRAEQ